MTVNISRSLNSQLLEGSTDGKYRKVRPNTTVADPNMGDSLVRANRQSLHPFQNYGYIDTQESSMVNPGGMNGGRIASGKGAFSPDLDNIMMAQNY
jgi:hypothetical protein